VKGDKAMQQVDISVAQTQITELLQSALRGEEIIITRDNHPILKLIQVSSQPKRRQRGSARGQIWMAADFDEPLEAFKEYTESGSA
jgi:antitoxin (DNA-binding transcriptional repressor) of toxin-antitoxin stability system